MNKEKKQQQPPTPVRLADDLLNWLKEQAVTNSRSLNREIAHRLEQSRMAQAASAKGDAPVIRPTEASVNPPNQQS